MNPRQAAENDNALFGDEYIHSLRSLPHGEIVHRIRRLTLPLMASDYVERGYEHLVLRLLRLRIDANKLHDILALRSHPGMYHHDFSEILAVLEWHDADFLVKVEEIRDEINSHTTDDGGTH